jgi:endonuclease-3
VAGTHTNIRQRRPTAAPIHRSVKKPFDIDLVMRRLRTAVKPYTPAAMFQLADEGYRSLFEQLVACIISIRTLEEVTLPTCRRLFAAARTPGAVAKLTVGQIDELTRTCTFHEPKAKTIREIASQAVKEFGGELPCDFDKLTTFRGVGPSARTWRWASRAASRTVYPSTSTCTA